LIAVYWSMPDKWGVSIRQLEEIRYLLAKSVCSFLIFIIYNIWWLQFLIQKSEFPWLLTLFLCRHRLNGIHQRWQRRRQRRLTCDGLNDAELRLKEANKMLQNHCTDPMRVAVQSNADIVGTLLATVESAAVPLVAASQILFRGREKWF
jgi:hypothetical protein